MNKLFYIILLLIIFILYIYFDNNKEGLQDFNGYKEGNATFDYNILTERIKYPDLIDEYLTFDDGTSIKDKYQSITKTTPYTPTQFNHLDNIGQYSKTEMETDFKYLNNGINLMVYNYYNDNGLLS